MTSLVVGGATNDSILEWVGPYRNPLEMYPDATQDAVDRHRGWLKDSFIDSVLPAVEAGRAVLVACDHEIDHEIDHGIWLEPAPAHTPGATRVLALV